MTAPNPVLASDELARLEGLERIRFRVPSLSPAIDAALRGGIASASVTCIGGERDDAAVQSTVRPPPPPSLPRMHTRFCK
jgi:hypothetical protein